MPIRKLRFNIVPCVNTKCTQIFAKKALNLSPNSWSMYHYTLFKSQILDLQVDTLNLQHTTINGVVDRSVEYNT